MTEKFTDPRLVPLNNDGGFMDDGMRRALCDALEPGEIAIAAYNVSAHIWFEAVLTDRALLLVKGALRAKVTRMSLPLEVTRTPGEIKTGVRIRTPFGKKTLWGSKLDSDVRLLLNATKSTTPLTKPTRGAYGQPAHPSKNETSSTGTATCAQRVPEGAAGSPTGVAAPPGGVGAVGRGGPSFGPGNRLISDEEEMKSFAVPGRSNAAGADVSADVMAEFQAAAEAEEAAAYEAELDAEIRRLEDEAEAEFQAHQAEVQAEIDRLQAKMDADEAAREARWAAEEAEAAEKEGRAEKKGPAVGKVMKLRKVPTYSRIRVIDWGSIEEVDEEISFAVDDVVTLWTDCVEPENTFAAVKLRGVLGGTPELQWLPDDAKVEIVELPRFAGQPAELVRDLKPTKAPAGSRGTIVTSDGFHPLVWECDLLFSPVQGWTDPETSVEVLLCAINVAPDDGVLRPQLLAALRARYSRVVKDKDTYPPKRYPWRDTLVPSRELLRYLKG
jgi:hypothetical protein